jgi:hypothetical protein
LRLQGGWVQTSWWIPESSNFSAALYCHAGIRLDSCVAELTGNAS